MSFWSTEVNKDTKDPKRNFRFIVQMPALGAGNGSTVWYAKKIQKPNFSVTEAKHSFLNHTFYWPGRVEWQKISLTLVDPVDPNVAGKINSMMALAGYKIPKSETMLETMSKSKFGEAINGAKGQIGEVMIIQLGSDGDLKNPVEKWTLKNSFITNVKYGELDYENDDLTELELEFRFDWAECETEKGVVGFAPQASAQ